MKLSDAYKIVKNSIKNKTPVMLWGPPGIGKSSLVHQIAEETKMKVLDLRLAQLEPTDLRGVPMPDRNTGRANWYLPAFWPDKSDGSDPGVDAGNCPAGPGIIFLDEIEKAPVSVKNASLQLVLDRAIGQYELPNDWSIVCAGNREEDGCFSAPLGSALSNRMIHLEIEPNVEAWADWARDNGVIDDIIGFLHFKPELLYKQTEDHAFPTPRTWVIGSELIKSVKDLKSQKELLAASVGKGSAQEFTVWMKVYRNVDPEAIFNGHMPDFNGQDQSFKYAVTMAAAFYLRKRKGGIKKAEDNIAKFIDMIGAELRVVFLKQQTLPTMEAMMKHSAFKGMVEKFMHAVA